MLSARSNAEIDRLARLANVDVDNAPVTARHIIRRHQREDWPQAPQNNAVPNANRNSQNHSIPAPRVPRSEQPRPRDHNVPAPRVSGSEQPRPRDVASSDRNRRNVTDDAPSRQDSERNEEEDTTIHNDTAGGARSATVREAEMDSKHSKQETKQKERARVEPGGELREEEEERNAEQDAENDDNQDEANVDEGLSSFSEREQFLNDLQDYCEANGKALDTRCVIRDKEIDLWELFRAVSVQELPPDELDWQQVAEHVGFGRMRNGEAIAALLRSSYDRHLAGFVEAMMSFEENEEDPDEDIAEGEETLIGEGETEAESRTPRASQKNSAASPLSNANNGIELRKRLLDEQLSTPTKLAKRRRTVHSEIPVTPEDKLRTVRPLSAPASAPGNLQSTADQEQELPEVEDSQQRTPRRNQQHQQSPDEPDMTPSQQLRSETDSIASPEHGESRTPTLYYSPTASFPYRNSQLETIQEEDSTTSTPTKSRSKRRELPASFQQPREPRLMQLEERREKRRQLEQERRERQQQRQQQRLEEHRQQELRQEEERRREEEQQQQQQQEERQGDQAQEQEQEQEQELQRQRQRWHQDAADSSDTDPEVVQQSQEQFISWKEHYLDQGFSEEIIIEAMRRTTMTPGEAMEAVLASLRDGQGIPPNHEGIWTDRDDAQLKYVVRVGDLRRAPDDNGDARRRKEKARKMLDRLLFKHDEPRVKLRRKFHRAVALAERDRRRRDRQSREGNDE